MGKNQVMEIEEQNSPLKMIRRIPKVYYLKPYRGGEERVYLPADEYSMKIYLRRGFRIDQDQSHHKIEEKVGVILTYDPEIQEESPEEHKCEVCGKVCDNPTSLGQHKRTHKKK